MTEQAGVTTPVTDRPLTAEDVALLREGDLLRVVEVGSFLLGRGLVDGGKAIVRSVDPPYVDVYGPKERSHNRASRFTFVSRPTSVSADPVGGVTSGAGEAETQTCVDWDEYADDIADAISDSMDMDWTSSDGARAVVRWLNENAPYSPALTPSPPVQLSERERALEGALRGLLSEVDRVAAAQGWGDHGERERARALTAQPAGEPTHG